MTNALDGSWSNPPEQEAVTIIIPVVPELLDPDADTDAVADLVAGMAARKAYNWMIERRAEEDAKRAETQE